MLHSHPDIYHTHATHTGESATPSLLLIFVGEVGSGIDIGEASGNQIGNRGPKVRGWTPQA